MQHSTRRVIHMSDGASSSSGIEYNWKDLSSPDLLTRKQAQAYTLCEIKQMTYANASDIMGVSGATVGHHYRQAKSHIDSAENTLAALTIVKLAETDSAEYIDYGPITLLSQPGLLTQRQAQSYFLYRFTDRTHDEIGDILNTTDSNVWHRYNEAKSHIKSAQELVDKLEQSVNPEDEQ